MKGEREPSGTTYQTRVGIIIVTSCSLNLRWIRRIHVIYTPQRSSCPNNINGPLGATRLPFLPCLTGLKGLSIGAKRVATTKYQILCAVQSNLFIVNLVVFSVNIFTVQTLLKSIRSFFMGFINLKEQC